MLVLYSHSLEGTCIFIVCAEAFYLRHNPAKIDTVPAIVRAYRERISSPKYVFVSLSLWDRLCVFCTGKERVELDYAECVPVLVRKISVSIPPCSAALSEFVKLNAQLKKRYGHDLTDQQVLLCVWSFESVYALDCR